MPPENVLPAAHPAPPGANATACGSAVAGAGALTQACPVHLMLITPALAEPVLGPSENAVPCGPAAMAFSQW